VQATSQFNSSKQIGCHYHIYVEVETLKTINPFTMKDKGKKYKTFFSSCSAEHAKELAFNYIKETMAGY
jgi:hypothetical protein